MSSFFAAIQVIGPLFLVIFAGIIISRNKIVDEKWIEILNNYALFIGLLIAIYQVPVPNIIMSGLDLMANSVTGVVLFSLGLFVGRQSLGKISDWIPVFAFSLIILFIQPLIFYMVSRSFVRVSESQSWILESAMPLGLTPYALSLKYQLDVQFTSRVVVASTLMALVSLPIWLVILG